MREVSLRALLADRREANPQAYAPLRELINLDRPDEYQSLTSTTVGSYQRMRSAGFPSESLVDALSSTDLNLFSKVLRYDPSRVFREEDIDHVVNTYALRKYRTADYQGRKWEQMERDLSVFQEDILGHSLQSYGYHVVGLSSAMTPYPVSKSRIPLLFYHIGEGFYFLVSTYENWVPTLRKLLFIPIASTKNYVTTLALLGIFYLTIIALSSIIGKSLSGLLVIIVSLSSMIVFSLTMLRPRTYPDQFPDWLNRWMYKLLPY
ncbi:MAG: hypothetical protein WA960_15565 [Tunicatimonas sp.]